MKVSSAFRLFVFFFNPTTKKTQQNFVSFLHSIEGHFTYVCVRLSECEGSSIESASGKSFS